MTLLGSSISCGIYQLYGFPTDSNPDSNMLTKEMLQAAIRGMWHKELPKCAFIIASLNHLQKKAYKFLLDNGFEQYGKWTINPNTNSKIVLLILKVWPDADVKE